MFLGIARNVDAATAWPAFANHHVNNVPYTFFHREAKNLQDLQDIMLDERRRPKALLQGELKSDTFSISRRKDNSRQELTLVDLCNRHQQRALMDDINNADILHTRSIRVRASDLPITERTIYFIGSHGK